MLLSIIFIGCDSNEKKSMYNSGLKQESQQLLIEPDTIYDVELAIKLWEKQDTVSAIIIDTACIKQKERAKTDIDNGKLIYYRSKIWYEWKEMAELLSDYDIEYKDFDHFCFGPPPGFEYDCYEKEMWNAINNKLGANTIDSLWQIAEKKFVLKYTDSVYIKDGIDIRSKYLTE